jgi:2-oxo-hept-3-ene-1,7-dioate hydratase
VQNAVSISEPDYGVLFADIFLSDRRRSRSTVPRAHGVELAFMLETPLEGPEYARSTCSATEYVTPALNPETGCPASIR